MKLVICEKPKVAEKIAYAIGRGSAERKSLYGVAYYVVERDGETLVVVSAVGHLYTLRQTLGGRGYPVFDVEWAPTHEVEKGADYSKKYLEAIEKLAPGASEYVCACDYDVEGSLIGYNVMRLACGAMGSGETGATSRMKFSALTPDDLEGAFAGRGPMDTPNALAGEARHMLDWFYGINLSRALMASIRSAGANRIMSIGRVQGPALSILAKKERDIAAFVSAPYWEVGCRAKGAQFWNTKGRFARRELAQSALAASKSPGTVKKVEKREYRQPPPPPFDLTSLQVEAYRLFGFAPALTLELSQSLYEGSLISYPRTSSQKLPAKLNLRRIIESLSRTKELGAVASRLLSENRTQPSEGKKDDPAHPAIHPTGLHPGQALAERQAKLYDLIARRFLSCFCAPAVREAQKVELLSGSEGYSASGNRTVTPGWFDTYAPYVKLEEITLPQFSEGESVPLSDFSMEEKKTQPPKRYTPASIVSELEKLGLGTKATRATIVDTLFKRGYLEGTSIKVTPFGMAVHESLGAFAPEILDANLTRGIEEEMEKIQDGENEKKAIENGKQVLRGILDKFGGREKEIGLGLLSGLKRKELGDNLLGKCRECGGDLRAIRSRLGKQFAGCSGYPECTSTFPLPQNAKIVPLGAACGKCGTPTVRVIRKGRKNFDMCLDTTCETKRGWARPQALPPQQKQAGAQAQKAQANAAAQAQAGAQKQQAQQQAARAQEEKQAPEQQAQPAAQTQTGAQGTQAQQQTERAQKTKTHRVKRARRVSGAKK